MQLRNLKSSQKMKDLISQMVNKDKKVRLGVGDRLKYFCFHEPK